jgi:hypothetical protein
VSAILDNGPAAGRSRSTRLVVRLALAGAWLGVVAGLAELLVGPDIRSWVGDKQDTTRLGLATLLLALVALAAATSLARRAAAPAGRRLLLALGLLVPGLVGLTTTGSLWYLPGALLVSAGTAVAAGLRGEWRELAVTAERHWTAVLAALLALFYAFLGATALGLAGAAGIAGGLLVLGLVVGGGRLPRPLMRALLVLAAVPFAALTWWSVVTPLVAVLLVATGLPAVGGPTLPVSARARRLVPRATTAGYPRRRGGGL